MLRHTASVLALSAGLAVGACNQDKKETENRTDRGASTTTTTARTTSDSNALAMITALNQGEVDQANAAMPKLAHDDAKNFADMMLKHHSEALAKVSTIVTEQKMTMLDNATSNAMKRESAELVGKMSTATAGPVFDRMYMQAQVDGHTKALRMIDNDILPNIDNMTLKTTVTDMRRQVQEHLTKAQSILGTMPAT